MSASAARGEVARTILVVGLGNPDRGDDGVGLLVAHHLADRLPEDVALRERSSDLISLIEEWSGCDAVVCIDAAASMGAPGRIHRIDLAREELPAGLSLTSSHAFGLAEVVRLARTLERVPGQMIVYAIEGRCFERGAPISAAVTAVVNDVVDRVAGEVDRLRR